MTCIVGIEDRGSVHIGGDSAGVAGLDLTIREDSKVFAVGPMVFGFTSSFRMGQLLRYALKVPQQEVANDYQYLCTNFINAVRKCLKNGGYSRVDDNEETGGTFLLGYRGKLYCVEGDFQVGKNVSGYGACGCGAPYALGSLHATERLGLTPKDRIMRSLRAAAQFSAGVAPPFKIIASKTSKS